MHALVDEHLGRTYRLVRIHVKLAHLDGPVAVILGRYFRLVIVYYVSLAVIIKEERRVYSAYIRKAYRL